MTAPRVPGVSYLVCATQRSGSTLLCELLSATEVAGAPDEYFEALRATGMPRQPRQYFEEPSVAHIAERLPPIDPGEPERPGQFEGWFRYVLQRGTSRNGVFGAKMMWNYFDDFRARVGELPGLGELTFTEALDEVFPQLRIIFVRRRDKVPQAVSLWKAIQTQQWRTDSEATDGRSAANRTPELSYDFEAIGYLLEQLHRWDARWEDWFHATEREPIRIFYEEFVESRAVTVGRVLDELGIDPEPDGPRMQRQADDVSRDWVTRFRKDAEAQHRA